MTLFRCNISESSYRPASIFPWSQRLYNLQIRRIQDESKICKAYIANQQLEKFKEKIKNQKSPIQFEKQDEVKCDQYIKEHRLIELARENQLKKAMKEEKTKEIYRTHLASKVISSVLRDFLSMRYK